MTNERTNGAAPVADDIETTATDWSASRFGDPTPIPTASDAAPVADNIADDTAPDGDAWDDYRGTATFSRLGNPDGAGGAPVGWPVTAPDPYARPDVDARQTFSRKNGAGFRPRVGAEWRRTTGDDVDVIYGPTVDGSPLTAPAVIRGDVDAAHGVTRESALVGAANRLIAESAGRVLMLAPSTVDGSPRVSVWDDTAGRSARLGGFALTDHPSSRSRGARECRPSVVGSLADRGIADASTVDGDDYCATHDGAVSVCGCVIARRATLAALARNRDEWRELAPETGDAWHGFDGETTLRGSWSIRESVGAPSRSVVYDRLTTFHETTNETGDVIARVRGLRDVCATVIYDDGRNRVTETGGLAPNGEPTATVHVDGCVTAILGWVERVDVDGETGARLVTRVARVGFDPFDVERREPSTRAGRTAARAEGAALIARRRHARDVIADALDVLAVGERATVDVDGATVAVARPDASSWSAGRRHGATRATVAQRAARDVIV
jgi:hypothetical protein